jgi:hypothetical protein
LIHVQRGVQPVNPTPPRQQHPQRNNRSSHHDGHIIPDTAVAQALLPVLS